MKYALLAASCAAVFGLIVSQEEGEGPEHVTDPAKCTTWCFPPGWEGGPPKGVPEGTPGVLCEGDHCAKAMTDEEHICDKDGTPHCSKWCSEVCCQCLAVCM